MHQRLDAQDLQTVLRTEQPVESSGGSGPSFHRRSTGTLKPMQL